MNSVDIDTLSADSTNDLLLQGWPRALQTRFSRSEHDTTVSCALSTPSAISLPNQHLQCSNLSAFQSYFSPVIKAVRNPSSLMSGAPSPSAITPEAILSRIRNLDRAQMVSGGILVAEVLGFFTVGEMIGRMKLVGYRGDTHAIETATPHGEGH